MDGLFSKIIENYDINTNTKNVRNTKGYYIIGQNDGESYQLRKSTESDEHIILRHKLQGYLVENGFLNIEKIYATKTGMMFSQMGDQRYILCDHIAGHEANFGDRAELGMIMSKLAEFHQKSCGLDIVSEPFVAQNLKLRLQKMQSELALLRKKVIMSKGLSDFDLIFLKNYDHYERNIHVAANLLDKADYQQKFQNTTAQNMFTHNMLKKETIVIKDGEVFITALAGVCVDHFSADIAQVINKYIKYTEGQRINVTEIINMYSDSGHIKMDADDYKIILARLLIPSSFLGAAKEYYAKKRSWAPGALISELEQEVGKKVIISEYIEPLACFCGTQI